MSARHGPGDEAYRMEPSRREIIFLVKRNMPFILASSFSSGLEWLVRMGKVQGVMGQEAKDRRILNDFI